MLYGEKVMRTAISLCSIDHCMDSMKEDLDIGLGVDLGIGGLTPPKELVLPAGHACDNDNGSNNDEMMKVCLMSPMHIFNFSSTSDDDCNGFCSLDEASNDNDFSLGFFADFE